MKCKLIKTKKAYKNLETELNEFLAANPGLNIKHVTQSFSRVGESYTLFFYEE